MKKKTKKNPGQLPGCMSNAASKSPLSSHTDLRLLATSLMVLFCQVRLCTSTFKLCVKLETDLILTFCQLGPCFC